MSGHTTRADCGSLTALSIFALSFFVSRHLAQSGLAGARLAEAFDAFIAMSALKARRGGCP